MRALINWFYLDAPGIVSNNPILAVDSVTSWISFVTEFALATFPDGEGPHGNAEYYESEGSEPETPASPSSTATVHQQ